MTRNGKSLLTRQMLYDRIFAMGGSAFTSELAKHFGISSGRLSIRLTQMMNQGMLTREAMPRGKLTIYLWSVPGHTLQEEQEPLDAVFIEKDIKDEPTPTGSRIVRLTNSRHVATDCCGSRSGHWRVHSILGGNESVLSF